MYMVTNFKRKELVTPEATSYRADSGDDQTSIKRERIKENAEKSAKILADEGKQVKQGCGKYSRTGKIYLIISGKSLILTNQLIRIQKKGC